MLFSARIYIYIYICVVGIANGTSIIEPLKTHLAEELAVSNAGSQC